MYYETNDFIINNNELNITFDDFLTITNEDFAKWSLKLRLALKHNWDVNNYPITGGYTKDEIRDQFIKIHSASVVSFLTKDYTVLNDQPEIGGAIDCWFPEIGKTKVDGISQYDYLIDPAKSHIEMLHFYHTIKYDVNELFSKRINIGDKLEFWTYKADHKKYGLLEYEVKDPVEFIEYFEKNIRKFNTFDYWLCPAEFYNKPEITISELPDCIPASSAINMVDGVDTYHIMLYEKGQKIFPKSFEIFNESLDHESRNINPLIIKFLLSRYIPSNNYRARIFDPFPDWGSTMVASLSHDKNNYVNFFACCEDYDMFETMKHLGDSYKRITKSKNSYYLFDDKAETIINNKTFKSNFKNFDIIFITRPIRDDIFHDIINTCKRSLRQGGFLIMNLYDREITDIDMNLYETLKVIDDYGMYSCMLDNKNMKYTPIYIFRKI